jgi:hypothetical protein
MAGKFPIVSTKGLNTEIHRGIQGPREPEMLLAQSGERMFNTAFEQLVSID